MPSAQLGRKPPKKPSVRANKTARRHCNADGVSAGDLVQRAVRMLTATLPKHTTFLRVAKNMELIAPLHERRGHLCSRKANFRMHSAPVWSHCNVPAASRTKL